MNRQIFLEAEYHQVLMGEVLLNLGVLHREVTVLTVTKWCSRDLCLRTGTRPEEERGLQISGFASFVEKRDDGGLFVSFGGKEHPLLTISGNPHKGLVLIIRNTDDAPYDTWTLYTGIPFVGCPFPPHEIVQDTLRTIEK